LNKIFVIIFFIILLTFFIFIPSSLNAAGFYIPDVGATCLGRGSAFVVRADDLTAIYHNPAGLARLNGVNILLDAGLMHKSASFDRADEENVVYPEVRAAEMVSPIPFLGIGSDFGSKKFTLALGAYGPYGVPEVKFPEDGPQRYNIVESSMEQVHYTFGAGFKITDWFNLGINFGLVDLYVTQKMKFFTGFNDADLTYKLSAHGSKSWAIGGIWKIIDELEVGMSYQPKILSILEGYLTASNVPLLNEVSDNIKVSIELPPILRGGVRYIFAHDSDVEIDAVWMGWSTIKDYTGIFETGSLFGIQKVVFPKNWHDAISIRVGGDYNFSKNLTFRAGYFYDQATAPEETIDASSIDLDGHGLAAGISYEYKNYTFRLSYSHIFMPDTNVNNSIAGSEVSPPVLEKKFVQTGDILLDGICWFLDFR
jgi:long-chain fatty acid transport protein